MQPRSPSALTPAASTAPGAVQSMPTRPPVHAASVSTCAWQAIDAATPFAAAIRPVVPASAAPRSSAHRGSCARAASSACAHCRF